jgi:hypothetical protein
MDELKNRILIAQALIREAKALVDVLPQRIPLDHVTVLPVVHIATKLTYAQWEIGNALDELGGH